MFSTAWDRFPLRDHPAEQDFVEHGPEPPAKDDHDGAYCSSFAARDQMRHLRNRSSYLIPMALPMGSHVTKAIGAVTIHTIIPILWFLAFTTVLTTSYMLMVSLVYQSPEIGRGKNEIAQAKQERGEDLTTLQGVHGILILIAKQERGEDLTLMKRAGHAAGELWRLVKKQFKGFWDLVKGGGWTGLLVGIFYGLLAPATLGPTIRWQTAMEDPESYAERKRLEILSLCTFSILVLLLGTTAILIKFEDRGAILLIPFLFCVGALIGSFILLALCASCDWHSWNRITRSRIYLSAGVFLYCLIGTLILALLPGFIKEGNPYFIIVLQAVFVLAIRLLWKQQGKTEKEKPSGFDKFLSKIQGAGLNLLVPVFLFLSVVAVGSFIDRTCLENGWPEESFCLGCLLVILISFFVMVCLLSCINFNRISHHFFYRDRLAEAFLMTFARHSNVHGEQVILSARNAVDMPLASLHGNDEHHVCDCAARGPYHLINASLNLTGSHDLSGFRRQSEVFLFSRCFTGSDRTGYIRTKEYGNNLKVARAMTVSGAAVTSVMGAAGSLAASFACTILGVRLGFWLQNPRDLAKNKKRFRWFWLSALLAELLRYTHARKEYIYLSDGGHSGDNLGILSLFRRRAKFIIASDAECDLSHSFNSLNSSLRRAYVDHGIKVDLEISKDNLELDEDRRTKTHFVLGRILYPDRPWQPSWLLVIKNSITGDELAPILNYKKKSPAFPHETTADQFFSEEQFESYRALGRHAAESTFTMNKPLFKSPKWSQGPMLMNYVAGSKGIKGTGGMTLFKPCGIRNREIFLHGRLSGRWFQGM